MGTTWSLRLVNPDYAPLAPVHALVQSILDEVIAQMSNWEADSRLSRFSAAVPGSWHELPAELAQVIDAALHWAQACDGAWDPTVGVLVALWGYGPRAQPQQAHSGQLPSDAEIAQALRHCGYKRLQWEPAQRRLWQPGGLQLDLSGIAKGFAVDWVASACKPLAGSMGCWRLGRDPGLGPAPRWTALARGCGRLAAGSAEQCHPGNSAFARRCPGHLGRSLACVHPRRAALFAHHRPRTGQPVAHALTSVTVFHAACMHADALATVLTVLGPQAGWDFALAQHVAAIFHTHPDAAHPQGSGAARRHGMGVLLRWRPWTIRAACALWDAIPGN
jgi:thiamine biosynthesis lipoprotein